MARTANFHLEAIEELFRQLRFAPAERRFDQMNRAERLADEIVADQFYPHDFVVYRVTGYRPSASSDEPQLHPGGELLADLATFIHCLSTGLDVTEQTRGCAAFSLDDVADRLGVSKRTVARYREMGLIAHEVVHADGARRLSCFEDALGRFEAGHPNLVRRANRFTRLTDEEIAAVIEQARALRAADRCSLSTAAHRIADDLGRAHETIRGVLRRYDARSPDPIFAERGPLTDRDCRFIHRALGMGASANDLAARLGKSASSIRRARNMRQAELLRAVELFAVDLPTFERAEAESVILAAPDVRDHLDDLLPDDDAFALIAAARQAPALAESTEDALVAAMHFLRRRLNGRIPNLPQYPLQSDLDAVETDLRFVLRIERRLLSLAMPEALRRIEHAIGGRIEREPRDEIVRFLRLGRDVMLGAIDRLDPARGQRLERTGGYALERALARSLGDREPGARAAARHEDDASLPLAPALYESLAHWQPLIDLSRARAGRIRLLPDERAELLADRYGLAARPPMTLADLAEKHNTSVAAVVRKLNGAEDALRRFAVAAQT